MNTADSCTLIQPDEGSFVDGSAVHFEWSADPAAVGYRLQVATDAAFDTVQIDTEVGTATSLTVYDAFPVGGGQYFWRVEAERPDGASWSESRVLRVVNPERVGIPESPAPRGSAAARGGSSALPIPVAPIDGLPADGAAATLEWTLAADARSYRIQIGDDAEFERPRFDTEVGDATSLTLYDMLPVDGPELVWRVGGRVGDEWGWSEVARFRAVSDVSGLVTSRRVGAAGKPVAASRTLATAQAANEKSALGLVLLWAVATISLGLLIIIKVIAT